MIYQTPIDLPNSPNQGQLDLNLADVASAVTAWEVPVHRTDADGEKAEPLFIAPVAVTIRLRGDTKPVATLYDDPPDRENAATLASDFLAAWQWWVHRENAGSRAAVAETEAESEPLSDEKVEQLCRQNPALRVAAYVMRDHEKFAEFDIDLVVKSKAVLNLARAGKLMA